MRSDLQITRLLAAQLPVNTRRIVVLTGARQTGKTTLVRRHYPALRYLNLDAIENRETVRHLRTAAWSEQVGPAVIDEAQKEPSVFEKVKYAYDEGCLDFSVLLGSSRFLLMKQVRESLAGRAFVYHLWPLMLAEIAAWRAGRTGEVGRTDKTTPLLATLLQQPQSLTQALERLPETLLPEMEHSALLALEHLHQWGGMPELAFLEAQERRLWLRSYQQTFLERDLRDLAQLPDLVPFRRLQRLAMLRSGQLLSYNALASDAQLSATTARRYLDYLDLSFQIFRLQPYHRNLTSQVVKSPKLYWTDVGLWRQGTGQWQHTGGHLFETLVITEIHKMIDTLGLATQMAFYRTRSGMEVDLLLENESGLIGCEIKQHHALRPRDLHSLRELAKVLKETWRAGFVIYPGRQLTCLDKTHRLWAMPVHRLLAAA